MAGLLQAGREAEADVYVLLVAAKQLPNEFPWVLMKYVVVAELAFVDVVRNLSAQFMAQHAPRLDADRVNEIRGVKKTFDRAFNGIEKRLRDYVRNIVSAHRHQQTVQSIHETHAVLRDPALPALFHSARTLLDAWLTLFGDRYYLELQRTGRPGEEDCIAGSLQLAVARGVRPRTAALT